MDIFAINNGNTPIVAGFMAAIKPEWWNAEGAADQLSSAVGWYFGPRGDQPAGFLLCKALQPYRTGEIECLGYDDNGSLKIGKELQPLVEKAEEWARTRGYAIMRFTIGSRGLSCHLRELEKPWEELRDIHAIDREEFGWFLSMGYVPSGILPDIYGEKYHGVLLVKKL